MAAGALARGVTLDKYAKPEIERRFRLDGVPPEASDPVEITDRYLEGGHLRLRCVRVCWASADLQARAQAPARSG